MARTKLVVSEECLKNAVAVVEANGPLTNRDSLYKAVEAEYNKNNPEATITKSVVVLRISEFKIPLKTLVGKKGRPAKVGKPIIVDYPVENKEAVAEVKEMVADAA